MPSPVVIARAGAIPAWAYRIDGRVNTPGDLGAERLGEAGSVWIDGSLEHALDVARTVHRLDPAIQVGVVTAREDRALIERRLIFTPGLGEVWLVLPEELDADMMARAAEVTGTRRAFRGTRRRLSQGTAQIRAPTRSLVSDAYLAALLEVLPDPVLSVDENGAVVTWSAAAARMLERGTREAVGRAVAELLRTDPPDALESLLAEARSGKARREMNLLGVGEPLVAEAVAIPVTAEGIHVVAIVLRDLTEERRTLRQLREQAAALEEERNAAARLAEERDVALQRLREAMEVRSRFFASMSHEIRTPINAIMGYNDLLLSGAMGDVEAGQLAHIERSQTAARHLLELVNDVLDLSKLEAGKIELKIETVASGTLMDELAATLQPLADQHDTVLKQECAEPGAIVQTDPRRVKQILLNLVSNAVKFGEGRPVLLRCAPDDGGVRFEVEDQGRGIAPEDQERIFEEFAQVGATNAGTGLGLTISRRLAEVLGGALEVESVPGEGSTFRLRLPAAEAADQVRTTQ